jgi:hypothetical protein
MATEDIKQIYTAMLAANKLAADMPPWDELSSNKKTVIECCLRKERLTGFVITSNDAVVAICLGSPADAETQKVALRKADWEKRRQNPHEWPSFEDYTQRIFWAIRLVPVV